MLSLTTAQRDLLTLLLTAERPLSTAALGARLHLTARQTQYGLREIRAWLERRGAAIANTPGVGVQIVCDAEQRQRLLADLRRHARFQVVLSPEQRQQLLALQLLAAGAPITLSSAQADLAVARATVLKDLDAIEAWLAQHRLTIMRRQHRGCWVAGEEIDRRQALAALLWGGAPFERPIAGVRYGGEIVFALAHDAALLPIIAHVDRLIRGWPFGPAHAAVARAEEALGARFTDEAAEALALALAIQAQRAPAGHVPSWGLATFSWAQGQVVWPLAQRIVREQCHGLAEPAQQAEAVAVALQLLSGAREEPWRVPGAADLLGAGLIDALAQLVAEAYQVPDLAHDALLRDGLDALIGPACVRARFRIWAPPRPTSEADLQRHAAERAIAERMGALVSARTGMALPPDALGDLTLLLSAAVMRARPERARHVLVVCPAGMATTQLLVARLRSRFPRLGVLEVLPIRALSAERLAHADLIITTVPLALEGLTTADIIHVHPMLRPEDVATLTQWMAQ